MTRYIMVGGFLGAGKTTAMLRFGQHLADKGLRVGLITNDQSSGLVDTAMLSASGFPVEEITGGCFCCRFTSLTDAAERLDGPHDAGCLSRGAGRQLHRPQGDGLLPAAPDVRRPLLGRAVQRPGRSGAGAARARPRSGAAVHRKVQYVYLKQLEEADVLVINKVDAVEPARVAALRTALAARFPRAAIFEVSAQNRRRARGLVRPRHRPRTIATPPTWTSTTTSTRRAKRCSAG